MAPETPMMEFNAPVFYAGPTLALAFEETAVQSEYASGEILSAIKRVDSIDDDDEEEDDDDYDDEDEDEDDEEEDEDDEDDDDDDEDDEDEDDEINLI
jgi:hypothetical protein